MPSEPSRHAQLLVNARLAAQVQRQQRELGELRQQLAELRQENRALKKHHGLPIEKPLVLPEAWATELAPQAARLPALPGCDLAALGPS